MCLSTSSLWKSGSICQLLPVPIAPPHQTEWRAPVSSAFCRGGEFNGGHHIQGLSLLVSQHYFYQIPGTRRQLSLTCFPPISFSIDTHKEIAIVHVSPSKQSMFKHQGKQRGTPFPHLLVASPATSADSLQFHYLDSMRWWHSRIHHYRKKAYYLRISGRMHVLRHGLRITVSKATHAWRHSSSQGETDQAHVCVCDVCCGLYQIISTKQLSRNNPQTCSCGGGGTRLSDKRSDWL